MNLDFKLGIKWTRETCAQRHQKPKCNSMYITIYVKWSYDKEFEHRRDCPSTWYWYTTTEWVWTKQQHQQRRTNKKYTIFYWLDILLLLFLLAGVLYVCLLFTVYTDSNDRTLWWLLSRGSKSDTSFHRIIVVCVCVWLMFVWLYLCH